MAPGDQKPTRKSVREAAQSKSKKVDTDKLKDALDAIIHAIDNAIETP